MANEYKQLKQAGNGLVVNGKPIEQATRLELIQAVASLHKEVKKERETGILLTKDFVRVMSLKC
jgi:hypothetical protein